MQSVSRSRGRARELAVLAAGFAACAALLWAGATVHDRIGAAGEVAIARLAGTAADTVVAEWERMLRAEEPPVAPAGEVFHWTTSDVESPARPCDPTRADADLPEFTVAKSEIIEPSVAATLFHEAERRELVERDPAAALELTLEALDKAPEESLLPELRLRALQLGARLDRLDVVRDNWELLRALPRDDGALFRTPEPILGWLSLPAEMRAAEPIETIVTSDELEKLFAHEDRVTLGTRDDAEARFELSPMLQVLLERLELPPPPLEHRKFAALQRVASPPVKNVVEHRWVSMELSCRPFFVRRDGEELRGFFYASSALKEALWSRSGLPAGFRIDLGDDDALGVAVRPRTELVGSPYAFTLRHSDPARIAREENARLRLLRGALFVLALACAAGGWLTARVLARERKLAELRSRFIAGVSHDLRTPLASILLVAENLESGAAEAGGRARYHAALRKEATRLRRLVDDVLDFSRLERGQAVRLEREDVELAPLLAEIEADARARVEAAGRAFTCERGALPASAWLDAQAVRRALDNLLENALVHGAGAVRLTSALEHDRLVLVLADEGAGVAARDRERVFEPFERAHAANGHAGGTGLGLAIVRAIARAHGGEARLRPSETGAAFALELPLAEPRGEET